MPGYVIYIHNINTIVQERYFTTICHRSRDWKEVNHIFGRCPGSWQHAWALMDRQWLNLELITLDCHRKVLPCVFLSLREVQHRHNDNSTILNNKNIVTLRS